MNDERMLSQHFPASSATFVCDAPCISVLVFQHSWIFINPSTATPQNNLLLPPLLVAVWIHPCPSKTHTSLASVFEGVSFMQLLTAWGRHCYDLLKVIRCNCFADVQEAATLKICQN